jgi:type I restriction enzyme S subunit
MGRGDFVSDVAGAVPVLTIGCLQPGGIDRAKAAFVTPEKATGLARYRLRDGDIVFSRMATVGRAGLVPATYEGALFNYHLMRLRLDQQAVEPRFLVYYVRGSRTVTDYVRMVNHGMTRDGINTAQLLSMPVPIAPRPQQDRIVAAIDSYFSRLDEAVMLLERVQRNLTRYRAAVLNAAVQGRLVPTEAELARREGRDYEPASVLLERILAERRRRWEEAELAGMIAAGKAPKDDRWKTKYRQPVEPDTDGLPRLPDGWCWATVDQVAADEPHSITDGPFGSNLKTEHYTVKGPRVIRLENVGEGEFIDLRTHVSEQHYRRLQKHRVLSGDIVVSSLGTDLPKACLVPQGIGDAMVKADCIRLAPDLVLSSGRYVMWALNAEPTRKRARDLIHGVGRPRIGLTLLRQIVIPLPPRSEQDRIVAKVDELLSDGASTAQSAERNLAIIVRLRQAILRWAFEGKLVDQDPNDEPASVLLARSMVERAPMKEAAAGARRTAARNRASA